MNNLSVVSKHPADKFKGQSGEKTFIHQLPNSDSSLMCVGHSGKAMDSKHALCKNPVKMTGADVAEKNKDI